jgi:hypothetical protein
MLWPSVTTGVCAVLPVLFVEFWGANDVGFENAAFPDPVDREKGLFEAREVD